MGDAPRKSRLSRSAEFDRVYRSGRSAQHRLLVLYRFDRPEDVPAGGDSGDLSRIGITVSKKLGGAVERNRLKRQLREALQASPLLDGNADYVAIARPGLAEKIEQDGFDSLRELVDELADKLLPAAAREALGRSASDAPIEESGESASDDPADAPESDPQQAAATP